MMTGRMTDAQATAMETAAGNPNGAMMGFMGMNMAMGANGGFNAQQMYQAGVQQQQQMTAQQQAQQLIDAQAQAMANAAAAPTTPANGWKCACGTVATGNFCPECGSPKPAEAEGWTCNCGAVNKGKFCQNCGSPKPAGAPLYQCDKCGWQPEDPHNPPKFCPECGDIFDGSDIK
jgi:membrane protease subunit (stomatin/prohibitin family)